MGHNGSQNAVQGHLARLSLCNLLPSRLQPLGDHRQGEGLLGG